MRIIVGEAVSADEPLGECGESLIALVCVRRALSFGPIPSGCPRPLKGRPVSLEWLGDRRTSNDFFKSTKLSAVLLPIVANIGQGGNFCAHGGLSSSSCAHMVVARDCVCSVL
jgi:hypothetical protein